jgi:hypothetical protein
MTTLILGLTNLWVILCITSVQSDGLEVKSAIEVDGSDQVSLSTLSPVF